MRVGVVRRGRSAAERQRERALETSPPGPLRELLSVPAPDPGVAVESLRLLAVDLETTGLDPATDRILSLGFVPVDGTRIVLGGAGCLVVRDDQGVGASATVHGLTDDDVATGTPLALALDVLFEALRGRVLLAHHATLEQSFLATACQRLWGVGLPVAAVDTLELQRRITTSSWNPDPATGSLRLWAARARFGLPESTAHEALGDALACAELYLAQVAELGGGRPLAAKRVICSWAWRG